MGISIDRIFNPRSIAVIGASPTPGKIGRWVLENLDAQGFAGEVFPVNPNFSRIMDHKCFAGVSEIPTAADLAVVLISASGVAPLLYECIEKGTRHFVVISAGFKEMGNAEGKRREELLSRIVDQKRVRIVGPNCLGVFDNVSKVDTFFLPRTLIQRPREGRVSIASQSGSFVGHLMDLAASENLGIARVITYGNRVDVNESDALEYFSNDSSTLVIGLYVEGVSEGRGFLKALERVRKGGKTVVALKAGKHDSLSTAITSHTGAIAGSYSAYRSAFKKSGVVEVDSLDEFVDACKAFAYLPPSNGRRVLIVGHAGGIGLNVADSCLSLGLEVPRVSEELKNALRKETLPFASVINPIDLTASGTDEQAEKVLHMCLRGHDFDIAIYLALWGLPQTTERIGQAVLNSMRKTGKPIVVATLAGKACADKRHVFEDLGIPVFPSPERSARVAMHLAKSIRRSSLMKRVQT